MKKHIIKRELKYVPSELIDAVAGLKTNAHWAVFVYLLDRQERTVYISDIVIDFETDCSEIKQILKDLRRSGLVSQHVESLYDIGTEDNGKIRQKVTVMGKALFDGMFDAIIPPIKKKE